MTRTESSLPYDLTAFDGVGSKVSWSFEVTRWKSKIPTSEGPRADTVLPWCARSNSASVSRLCKCFSSNVLVQMGAHGAANCCDIVPKLSSFGAALTREFRDN